MKADFVHLHTHSDFSLLKGNARIKDLIQKAIDHRMPALALTDTANMYGAMDFFQQASRLEGEDGFKVKPIIGCEIYLSLATSAKEESQESENPSRLVLLAKDHHGYKNLLKIVSSAFIQGYTDVPKVELNFIENHASNLICLSAGVQGPIGQAILEDNPVLADQLCSRLVEIFGKGDFYLEIQNHGLPEERLVTEKSIELSHKQELKLVATNDVHYVESDDAFANEILHAIQAKATVKMEKGIGRGKRPALPGSDYHFKSADEMKKLFADLPQAIAHSEEIAEKCNLIFPPVEPHMPKVDLPEGVEINDFLRRMCIEGLKEKLDPIPEDYYKRLDYELGIIKDMGFPAYFLIVSDFIQDAKDKGMLVGPGRGSAAGSLVAYALKITNLDPIEFGLLFERFLNPERVNMPDIDIDFQDNRREEVIEYCRKKYGKEKISQIITYGKLKAKAVFKDVARVFEVDFETANKLSSLIGDAKNLKRAYSDNQDFREAIQSNPMFQEVYSHSLKLEGLTRQTGIHAAGVIIADAPIDEYVPLSADEQGQVFTQFEGTMLEEYCGLIKMDFLGLKTLSILDETMKMIQDEHDTAIDLDQLPLDDANTYYLLSKGNAIGVFQFESAGMRKYLKSLKPTELNDLTAMNAMYRPGPLAWIPVYIAKKHNREIQFNTEEDEANFKRLEELCQKSQILKDILFPTNLIPIYQEQVMEIGRAFAGFSLGKADLMRRAMGKKKMDVLTKMKVEFIEGAAKIDCTPEDADFLFEKIIMPFANYGFNKSHAACYALVAYQTAYLKANYPDAFMTALLNSEIENTDKIKDYIQECRALGVRVLPPTINGSSLLFEVKKGAILYGLAAIKGVAGSAGGEIIANREQDGQYKNFSDFLFRNSQGKVNKQVVEQLIRSGAFDDLGLDAEQLLFAFPTLTEIVEKEIELRKGGQAVLFDTEETSEEFAGGEIVLEKASEQQSKEENLKAYELQGLGFNLKHDPINHHLTELKLRSDADINSKEEFSDGRELTIAGMIVTLREITTRKGDLMAFAVLENGQGKIDVVFFPKTYKKIMESEDAELIKTESLVLIQGKIQNNEKGVSLICDGIQVFVPGEVAPERYNHMHISFQSALNEVQLSQLKQNLHDFYGGQCRVFLHFLVDNRPITVKADSLNITPSEDLQATLEKWDVVERVWYN